MKFFVNDDVIQKTHDGQTTRIVQRNVKRDSFKNEGKNKQK